jgi:hypothetical protein
VTEYKGMWSLSYGCRCYQISGAHYDQGLQVYFNTHPDRFMEAKFGGTRTFGLFDDQMAQYGKVLFYHLWEFAVFIVMGVNGGLLGVAFIWLNKKLTLWRYKYELCSFAYLHIQTSFASALVIPSFELQCHDDCFGITVNHVSFHIAHVWVEDMLAPQ